jgi:hypothetical protein
MQAQAQSSHAGHASEVAAKAAHHVSEDQHHRQQHLAAQAILAQSQATSQSWAARVGERPAATVAKAETVKPRAASYAAQVDADASLDQGLSGVRA